MGGAGSVNIQRLIGYARMADMMLTGRVFGAAEAERINAVQYVVPKGESLAKATQLLADADAESKVVVLLNDGMNNAGTILPADAAEFAAEEGIRVYTVLAGRYVYVEDWFGRIQGLLTGNRQHHLADVRR